MGFDPVYRNSVALPSAVATPAATGGATLAGSGGNPPASWCNRKKRLIPVTSTTTKNRWFSGVGFCEKGFHTLVGERESVSSNTMLPGVFVQERRTRELVVTSTSSAGGDCAKVAKAPPASTTPQRRNSLFRIGSSYSLFDRSRQGQFGPPKSRSSSS